MSDCTHEITNAEGINSKISAIQRGIFDCRNRGQRQNRQIHLLRRTHALSTALPNGPTLHIRCAPKCTFLTAGYNTDSNSARGHCVLESADTPSGKLANLVRRRVGQNSQGQMHIVNFIFAGYPLGVSGRSVSSIRKNLRISLNHTLARTA